MEQKIFNSNKSRVKLDLKFNRQLWWGRSRRFYHNAYVCCIGYFGLSGFGANYIVKVDYISITPTCMI